MNAATKPSRSLIVSWLLGATLVAVVTFSFEALSARDLSAARCPATGAVAAAGATRTPACPAMEGTARCPASGATVRPAAPSGRCPAGGNASDPARAISAI